MRLPDTLSLIYSDFRRYRVTGDEKSSSLGIFLLSQGFWASCVYRISHSIVQIKVIWIRRPLRIIFLFIEKWIEIITGIRIPGECTIGKGLYIGHFGQIIVNDKVVIGENCNLSQGVTLGVSRRGKKVGAPILGDRVYIGPNAILFGNIKIGSDVAIGAGSVVTRSFEDRSVVAGNPATLISNDGSFEFVRFDDMDNHPTRLASIALRRTSQ